MSQRLFELEEQRKVYLQFPKLFSDKVGQVATTIEENSTKEEQISMISPDQMAGALHMFLAFIADDEKWAKLIKLAENQDTQWQINRLFNKIGFMFMDMSSVAETLTNQSSYRPFLKNEEKDTYHRQVRELYYLLINFISFIDAYQKIETHELSLSVSRASKVQRIKYLLQKYHTEEFIVAMDQDFEVYSKPDTWFKMEQTNLNVEEVEERVNTILIGLEEIDENDSIKTKKISQIEGELIVLFLKLDST
ncbi:MAG TPA: hypothetical protein VF209_03670 [Patescibacteria group bacterium]